MEKDREFDEDCVILDYDPFDSLKKLSINDKENEDAAAAADDDLSVIAERGQVACRDFPHSRHLCVKFPFSKTPHITHCEQCYCYVCDSIAPCKFWSEGPQEHCHAIADDPKWQFLRQAGKPTSSTQGNLLDQLIMNIATAERHDSNLNYQNISVNQPTARDMFDYDSQRDYPSSQDMGSCGEGTDTFRCFNPPDHSPQEYPSAAGVGRLSSVPRFNGGRAGNRNVERYINDRYKNHHRIPAAGGQYGGGYTHGNHDNCYTGDRSPAAGGQYGGGYTHGNHDNCYTGDRSPAAGGQYGGGYTHGNHDHRYAGDRCPPAGGQSRGGHMYRNHDCQYAEDRCPPAERGDRYGGGGAWDRNHYNGYGNDRGYDKEGGHRGNIWEWRDYDKEGNHDRRYSEDSCPPAGGQFRGGSRNSPTQGRFEGGDRYGGGAWDRNHYNGYGNDRGYDKEGGHRGNIWEWGDYDKEGNHDRRYAEDSCPPAGGQFRGGSRNSPTQGRFEGGDRYGGGAWDRNHHNGYGNGRGYEKERGHKGATAERGW